MARPSRALRGASPLHLLVVCLVLLLARFATTLPLHNPSQTARVARIALLHMHDSISFFRRLGKLTGENKQRYATRHGYDMVFSTPYRTTGIYKPAPCDGSGGAVHAGPDKAGTCWTDDPAFDIDHKRAATFGKVRLALAACRGRDDAWLFWSDADALIVNQTVRMETVIDDAFDIILAYDWLMLNAGMLFMKCSPWTKEFLNSVYNARKFDSARALDQSSIQEHLDNLTATDRRAHVKVIPKRAMNVYTEEYRPGDFLVHFAGKLYEATEAGLFAIANQFDVLSMVDDVADIDAFFHGTHLLNYFSGTCNMTMPGDPNKCPPEDPRRITLHEPLGAMAAPRRYRHVGLRYYWLGSWEDKYDEPNWNKFHAPLALPDSVAHLQRPDEPPAAHHEQLPELPGVPPQAEAEGHGGAAPGRDDVGRDTKTNDDDDGLDLPDHVLRAPRLGQPGSKEALADAQAKEDAPEIAHEFDAGERRKEQKGDDDDDGAAAGPDEGEEIEGSWKGWVVLGAACSGAVVLVAVMRRRRKIQSKKQ